MVCHFVSAEKCTATLAESFPFPNGRITYNPPVVDGKVPLYAVASYHCNSGYNRQGGSGLTCRLSYSTPLWFGRRPTCVKGNEIKIILLLKLHEFITLVVAKYRGIQFS